MRRRAGAGRVLFFVLVAAALLAAVLVVRARTPDLVLEVTEPSRDAAAVLRVGGSPPRSVPITFFVREADSRALVGIVDSAERLVRTLDEEVALAEDEPVTYTWDGSTDAGGAAPSGRYRLLVELPSEDRRMVWPRRITLVDGADAEPAEPEAGSS